MQDSWVILKGSSQGKWMLLIVSLFVLTLGALELWDPEIITSVLTAIIAKLGQAAYSWGDFFRSL